MLRKNRNYVFSSLKIGIFFVCLLIFFNTACSFDKSVKVGAKNNLNNYPPVILWAWERPEDLRFIDTKKFGVAFLAQTLVLQNDEMKIIPRRQPLKLPPETFLIAVTRIESIKNTSLSLSDAQEDKIVDSIRQTIDLPNVKALQIDFDAVASERNFYKSLILSLRAKMPKDVSLTVTALASWCASDNWLSDFPVDEAIPMAFEMGADDRTIRSFLNSGNDWNETLCRASYGIALDEPLKIQFQPNRRFYIFNNRAWRADDLKQLPEGVLQ